MFNSLFGLFVLLCALCSHGQEKTTADRPAAERPAIHSIKEEPFRPFLFEPYRAEYVFRGSVIGVNFNLFNFSTMILELDDEWQETQKWRLAWAEREAQEIEVTSYIDLKTGLLKKLTTRFDRFSGEYTVGDGLIEAFATDGRKTRRMAFASPEKIYPCSFSTTFLSYLPLDDDFARSFLCFQPDENKSGKPTISFMRRTLRVVGSETITVGGESFDCYKLADETAMIKFNADGTVREKRQSEKALFDEESLWKNFYSASWIDKKTRRFVKGELKFKYGSAAVELQRSRQTNL